MKKFLPIILGSDENAYGCARMFYEINGEKSLLMCSRALLPCDNSGILTRRVIKDFDTDPVFGSVMKSVLSSLRNEAENLILISCSDYYAELVVNNAEMIRKYVASPILSEEVYRKICGKIRFAKLCRETGLPHPKTRAVLPSALVSGSYPEKFPVVIKPMNSNSTEYLKCEIPGKKKVYICENADRYKKTLENLLVGGYNRPVVVQEYIGGGEKNSRVVNAYCDGEGRVRLIGAARPLLEYKTDNELGNYAAVEIIRDRNLCDMAADFLEKTGYVGYANFDIRYDEKTGQNMFLELNPRQGRSSYYIHTAGENFMKAVYDDAVLKKPYEGRRYAEKPGVWINEPKILLEKKLTDTEDEYTVRDGKTDTAFRLKGDFSLPRAVTLLKRYAISISGKQ